MSKHQVAVLKVVSAQLSVTAAAAQCGISRGHLHRLLRRYRDGGLEALDTGEVLSSHHIEPDKGYWRNQRRDPGRWPGSQETG